MQNVSNRIIHPAPKASQVPESGGPKFASVVQSIASAGINLVRGILPGGSSLIGNPLESVSLDQMRQQQEASQRFSVEYLELQTKMQEDNRRFTTMSNLMKARHDTAKGAINNMHV